VSGGVSNGGVSRVDAEEAILVAYIFRAYTLIIRSNKNYIDSIRYSKWLAREWRSEQRWFDPCRC
jgi:hypothetical protein